MRLIDKIPDLRLRALKLHRRVGELFNRPDQRLGKVGAGLQLGVIGAFQQGQQATHQLNHGAVLALKAKQLLAQCVQPPAGNAGREHLPGTVGEVVRLVHQQTGLGSGIEIALDAHARVKCVVVIADDDIRRLRQVQRQFKGTQIVFNRQVADGPGIQPLDRHGCFQHIPAAVVVAQRVGTAHAVGLGAQQAALLLGGNGHGTDCQTGPSHALQRVLSGTAARGAGSEIEYGRDVALPQRLQRAEQGSCRLADAGGRFDQCSPAPLHGAEYGFCHLLLTVTIAVIRKGKTRQGKLRAILPVVNRADPFHVGPGITHEKPFQRLPIVILCEFVLLAVQSRVGQPHLRRVNAVVQAKQRGIDFPLSPVGGIIIFQNQSGILFRGLDLLYTHQI